ncbi:hypothetical protein [Pantoea agglomerans]|uniref:hypothetical protein n=1 Tax=Enterobacter agglomerans TaxID=549 RepID=UPI003C7DE47D
MAGIPYSVKKSIDDFLLGDLDGAMLHACNAVDGTSRTLHKGFKDNHRQRYLKTLRDNYSILRPMSFPNFDIDNIKWPIKLSEKQKSSDWPDIAEVIYGIHRCSHGHGEELPDGFQLMPDVLKVTNKTTLIAQPGSVRISDRVIFGLLAIAVLSPANKDLMIQCDHWLSLGENKFVINEWWGRKDDFLKITDLCDEQRLSFDFSNWYGQIAIPI